MSDTGKDQAPSIERKPEVLDRKKVLDVQQEALVLLAGAFAGTPLEPIFADDSFSGNREYNLGRRRNYEASRTFNQYGAEISLRALIKPSNNKAKHIGDEIRLDMPSSLSSHDPVFEHVIYTRDKGMQRTAVPNTDVNVESGLSVIRHIARAK